MMATSMISADDLRQRYAYDPITGEFTSLKSGKTVGCKNDRGYLKVVISGREYKLHRLAFLAMTGDWPKHEVDHINGIKSDNRWANLRDVDGVTNTHNQVRPRKDNSTGFLGVSWHRKSGRFRAAVELRGKAVFSKTFDTPEEAHAAYVEAKRRLHRGCTI